MTWTACRSFPSSAPPSLASGGVRELHADALGDGLHQVEQRVEVLALRVLLGLDLGELSHQLVARVADVDATSDLHTRELRARQRRHVGALAEVRSEEHTSELQSREKLVCRLLLDKKKG